jgi:hypothetical protein
VRDLLDLRQAEEREKSEEEISMQDDLYSKLEDAIREKIRFWSEDNHHCGRWGGCSPEEELTCQDKWHGYCGYEMEHGIELEDLRDELASILLLVEEARKAHNDE